MNKKKALDHREIGQQLGLFHFESEIAAASPFFMPKGAFIYNELKDYIRKIYKKHGYEEVITPQVMDASLWKTSGHYDHYKENMYWCEVDGREYGIKPMNCPGHMKMFSHYKRSYRELPLRYADFSKLHRYEQSGSISGKGLTRVRTFAQDDAHIFVRVSQLQEEIVKVLELFGMVYEQFGFETKVYLSTRPEEKKSGSDELWDKAEAALEAALKVRGGEYEIKKGDGAFYGPKIDIEVLDSMGRSWQLGTAQLDFNLPEKFELKFVNEENEDEVPVVIHRAIFGSIERFIAILLEHTQGDLPFAFAPEQAVLIPVGSDNEEHVDCCRALAGFFGDYRVKIDRRNESIGFRIREARQSKIPFAIVIGDKESENWNNDDDNDVLQVKVAGKKKPEIMTDSELLEKMGKLQNEFKN